MNPKKARAIAGIKDDGFRGPEGLSPGFFPPFDSCDDLRDVKCKALAASKRVMRVSRERERERESSFGGFNAGRRGHFNVRVARINARLTLSAPRRPMAPFSLYGEMEDARSRSLNSEKGF